MARVFKTGVTVEGDLAANSGNVTSSASSVRVLSPAAAAAPTAAYFGYSGTAPGSTTTTYLGGVASTNTISGITVSSYLNSIYGIASGATGSTSIGGAFSNAGTSTIALNTGFSNSGTSTVNINVWTNSSGTQTTVIGSTVGTSTLTINGTSTHSGTATFSAGVTISGANSPISLPTGGTGQSGQVLTSSGTGTTPTWTTPSSGATGFDAFMLMGA